MEDLLFEILAYSYHNDDPKMLLETIGSVKLLGGLPVIDLNFVEEKNTPISNLDVRSLDVKNDIVEFLKDFIQKPKSITVNTFDFASSISGKSIYAAQAEHNLLGYDVKVLLVSLINENPLVNAISIGNLKFQRIGLMIYLKYLSGSKEKEFYLRVLINNEITENSPGTFGLKIIENLLNESKSINPQG